MNGAEVATRTPMQEIVAQVRSTEFMEQVKQALPGNVTPERFVRVAVTAIQQQPELIVTDRSSLFGAIVKCAQDGLLPDGRQAALVIFNAKGGAKRTQYIPMVGGLRLIAADHGISLEAQVVYENDAFDWQLGFEPTVSHKPPRLNEDRGEPIGAYAVATDRSGQKYLEVMSRQEIEAVRKVSRAATSEYGPWVNWWGEMARKTVARRLFKQLPLGALDEKEARIVDQSDSDTDLPNVNAAMSVDEANVAAPLANLRPPTDDGPDDTIEDGEYTDPAVEAAAAFVIDEGQYAGQSVEEIAADAKGQVWLRARLKSLGPDDARRAPIEAFAEARLPDVWSSYQTWLEGQAS